jgi:hypothetical protein
MPLPQQILVFEATQEGFFFLLCTRYNHPPPKKKNAYNSYLVQ